MSHRNLLGVNKVCSERQSGKSPCLRWPSWASEHIGFMPFPVEP